MERLINKLNEKGIEVLHDANNEPFIPFVHLANFLNIDAQFQKHKIKTKNYPGVFVDKLPVNRRDFKTNTIRQQRAKVVCLYISNIEYYLRNINRKGVRLETVKNISELLSCFH